MKSSRFAVCLFIVAFARPPFVNAQTAPAPDAGPEIVSLETVPAQLQKIDDEVTRKLAEVRTVVETEAAAKRIPEPVAQSLRWSLRTTAIAGGTVDVRGIVSTMRVPPENAALTQAVKELETIYATAQTQRAMMNSSAAREIRRRMGEAVRSFTKPAEVDALQELLTTSGEDLRRRNVSGSNDASTALYSAELTLRGLRRLIEAEAAGKPEAIGQAVSQLRNDSRSFRDASYDNEIQTRLDRVVLPFAAAAEKAEEEVASAIEARKPAAEIESALVRLDTAAEQLGQVRSGSNSYGQRDLRQTATAYRTIAKALDALSDGEDENVRSRLSEARNATRQLEAKRKAAIETLLEKIETEIAEAAEKTAVERGGKLRARIIAVKQSADLGPIAADLRKWAGQAARSNSAERENWSQLASQLSTLSAAWATANPALLQQDRYGNDGSRGGSAFAGELAELRKRVERDVLIRALEVPELSKPPLAEQPPEAALETLCDDLAKRGDWRRLYDVLVARGAMQAARGQRFDDDAAAALRSYFTAQNLELAELWVEAASAYKAVLRSVSARAPIKPAAERLKTLATEHPEIVAAPAAPARPGFPQP